MRRLTVRKRKQDLNISLENSAADGMKLEQAAVLDGEKERALLVGMVVVVVMLVVVVVVVVVIMMMTITIMTILTMLSFQVLNVTCAQASHTHPLLRNIASLPEQL
jgi:type IV secretory pathway component VirB8